MNGLLKIKIITTIIIMMPMLVFKLMFMQDSMLYVVNGLMMMISFLVLRVVGMGLLGVKFLFIDRAEFFSLPMTTTCAALLTAPTHGAPSSPATCDVPWGARDAGFIWCRSSSSGTGCSSRGSRRSSAA